MRTKSRCGERPVTRAENFVTHKPAEFTFEEAATIPLAFLTAYYGVNHLAGLAEGERVLIHSASGGVGLAAVQLARRAGAQIFATAGSAERRDFLSALGIEHVMDSRSIKFADQVLERTNGEGVDVVLNSLPGEAFRKSWRSCEMVGGSWRSASAISTRTPGWDCSRFART